STQSVWVASFSPVAMASFSSVADNTDLTDLTFGSVGVGKGAVGTRVDGAIFDPHVVPSRL
ncbi:hypothetical protein ACNI3K_09425, partial [Demequina sp. SO4-13]|uniref:hypothetical protein n=1 Tax=Demequina sp. SO4-13 TaxID=3401027 RepID=UPI003AF64967